MINAASMVVSSASEELSVAWGDAELIADERGLGEDIRNAMDASLIVVSTARMGLQRRCEFVASSMRRAALRRRRATSRVPPSQAWCRDRTGDNMGKFRFRACLDQALFVLLIIAGFVMTAVFEARGMIDVVASASARHAATLAGTGEVSPAMAAASGARSTPAGTLLARLRHWSAKPQVRRT
jgi:hypothetical protein